MLRGYVKIVMRFLLFQLPELYYCYVVKLGSPQWHGDSQNYLKSWPVPFLFTLEVFSWGGLGVLNRPLRKYPSRIFTEVAQDSLQLNHACNRAEMNLAWWQTWILPGKRHAAHLIIIHLNLYPNPICPSSPATLPPLSLFLSFLI